MENQFLDVLTLLEKNANIFLNKKILIAGDIQSPNIIPLIKNSLKAYIIFDNIEVYRQALALFACEYQPNENETFHQFSYKHLNLVFSAQDYFIHNNQDELKELDTVLLLLTKSKQQSKDLLSSLNEILKPNTQIYIAGSNSKGGKSANSLLTCNDKTAVYKLDVARKCTLFTTYFRQPFAKIEHNPLLAIKFHELNFELLQNPAVFSYQKFDQGTKELLEAFYTIKDDFPHVANILDLGCGCGIISCILAKLGFKNIKAVDISANALNLSMQNIEKLKLNKEIHVQANSMLEDLDQFDLIITNPPFHDGMSFNKNATLNMLQMAKNHLTANGALLMVSNTFLNYQEVLHECFANIEILSQNGKFTVCIAKN